MVAARIESDAGGWRRRCRRMHPPHFVSAIREIRHDERRTAMLQLQSRCDCDCDCDYDYASKLQLESFADRMVKVLGWLLSLSRTRHDGAHLLVPDTVAVAVATAAFTPRITTLDV